MPAGMCTRLHLRARVRDHPPSPVFLSLYTLDTMDTSAQRQGQQVDVQARINEIKAHMPETYRAIQAKAAAEGPQVFALVRRALRGEANCFYAVERGWVAGEPFNLPGIHADVAAQIVGFGCQHLVMWAVVPAAAAAPAGQGA